MRLHHASPFVLIDDARPEGKDARLYRRPRAIIRAEASGEVEPALAAMRAALDDGQEVAGYIAYEAGAALEPRLAATARAEGDVPLVWLGVFDGSTRIDAAAVPDLLPDPAGAWVGAPAPTIDRAGYDAAFAEVQRLIAAGDIYQANLTFRASVALLGGPLAAYAAIRARAGAGYGGIVWTGGDWLLSFSPELFFEIAQGRITARPMKGTARRGATAADDAAMAAALAGDAKQRAENLMITDLMRNDLTRVAAPGSVSVPSLYAVETYPSVHQMTSTVAARLADGLGAADVLAALFPCGSVTGAPKIRAMEVIGAVEARPRGAYTGAIGFAGETHASFNVAIRTLHLPVGAETATIGLGSGVVADSRADAEWDECRAKGDFLTLGQRRFDLIETMAFDPRDGITRIERHLLRMKMSALRFGFTFDRHATRNELQATTFRLRTASRVRLLLAPSGAISIQIDPAPDPRETPLAVAVAPLPVDPEDFRLRHKTSDRRFYDEARRAMGADEVVFVDPEGRLTEGSFTNLFVERGGTLLTPPLARGLLPGVLREELIEAGRAVEADLAPEDLADGFFVGNALRGLMPAVAVAKEPAAAL